MNLSIKQFRAFLALYKYKNFTRAAQSVFLSQPAFSSIIYSLEKEVNMQLFYRDTKMVKLTADGEMFYNIANDMMAVFNRSIESIKDYTNNQHRRISIATLPSIAAQLLPSITEKFRIKYPDTHFDIKDMQTNSCIELIQDGNVDIAICSNKDNLLNINAVKIFSDPYYIVCHRDHPLSSKNNVSLDDISEYKLIRFANTTSIYQSLYENLDLENKDCIEIEQLSTLFGLLLSNSGITLLPELTLYLFRHQDIIIKPVQWETLERDIYLIHNKDRILNQSALLFSDFILQELNRKNKSTASD
jgi:LysR family carnitine catabolism transcriptional activator